MIHTGLVSVTFRKLPPAQIVGLVVQAGLDGIEWGGDIHVPHGDLERARQVGALTRSAGLAVVSYGSYYRVGHQEPMAFEGIVETALALGAPAVRVWAGKVGSADADPGYRDQVAVDSRRICDLAEQAGLAVAFEYHDHTLTDTDDSALRLLREVNHPALFTYWQARGGADEATFLRGLRAVLPWLSNVHVQGRPALRENELLWKSRLDVVRTTGRPHCALIEFVQDDAPEAFLGDAAVLRAWCAGAEEENR